MKLIKIKSVWHVEFTDASGKVKTVTTQCTDKKEAEQVAERSGIKELELAAKAGRLTQQAIGYITTGKKLTMEKALVDYEVWMKESGRRSPRTIQNCVTYLRMWIKDMKIENLPPSAITEKHINSWVNNPESETKAKTRVIMLAAIRSLFDLIAARGWSPANPSRAVEVNHRILSHSQKEPTHRQTFTDPEYKKLLSKTEGFWHVAIRLAREHGFRLGDICNLEWSTMNNRGEIVVHTGKTNTRVEHAKMSKELQEAISSIPVTDKKYVFPEQRELMNDETRRAYLSVSFKRICERLEIRGKSFHCLRHTFATEAAREGKDIKQIGKDMGHRRENTTRGYVHNHN